MAWHLAVLLVGLGALAGPARAQADGLADLRLATAVRLALLDDVRTRALDVQVTARRGAVSLEGSLPPTDLVTVREVARRVAGVTAVDGQGAGASGGTERPASGRMPDPRPAPSPRPTTGEPSVGDARAVYHVVAQGETLFSLARRYETTVGEVQRLNGMADASIRVGQRLRMR